MNVYTIQDKRWCCPTKETHFVASQAIYGMALAASVFWSWIYLSEKFKKFVRFWKGGQAPSKYDRDEIEIGVFTCTVMKYVECVIRHISFNPQLRTVQSQLQPITLSISNHDGIYYPQSPEREIGIFSVSGNCPGPVCPLSPATLPTKPRTVHTGKSEVSHSLFSPRIPILP